MKISFSYEKHVVIKNLSLRARPGEHIGIVGDSGCGKSTVLKILAGLYEPDSGTAVIAGERWAQAGGFRRPPPERAAPPWNQTGSM